MKTISVADLKAKAEQQRTKATQELERLESQYQKRLQETAKATQQVTKSETERIKQEREQLKLTRDLEREEERKQKQQARADKLTKQQNSAYAQLAKSTRDLKNKSKDLGAEMLNLELSGKKNTAEYKRLSTQYQIVTAQAQKADMQLKKLDATVGDNFRNVGNYQSAMNGLSTAFSAFGVAFGVTEIIGGTIRTLATFDEGVANMAKTLNISSGEAKQLSQELLKIDTRTSVEGLQQIATIGGQLGISSKDIVAFTDSVDKLNVSLGDEFTGGAEEITSVVGGLRNVFSDIKSDNVSDDLLKIGNALNVLGAEGAATSPVMSDFASRIGGVGIPLGLSTDQVLGLSATLQELNVSAERGGTAVGNILKKMAQDTEGFAKFAGVPLQEFEQMVNTDIFAAFQKVTQATQKYKGNSVGLAQALDALKIDGAGASEVFLKLGSNMELLNTRTDQAGKSLQNTDSIMNEFGKKNETLQAKIEKLQNAIQKYVLGIDESGFATGSFGKILDFLASNLGMIMSIVGKLIVAWGSFKALQLSLMAIEKARAFNFAEFGKQLAAQIPITRAYRLEQIQAARASQQAGNAIENTGRAMNAVPWVAIIGVVIELASAFIDVATGAARAREQAERLQNYRQRASDDSLKNITAETDALDKLLNQRNRDLQIALAKAKTDAERKKIEQDFANLKEQDIKKTKEQIKTYRNSAADRLKQYRNEKKELEDLQSIRYGNRSQQQQARIDEIQRNLGVSSWGSAAERFRDAFDILDAKIQATGTRVNEYNKALTAVDETLKDASTDVVILSEDTETHTDKIERHTKASKDYKTVLGDINDYLDRNIELTQELLGIDQDRQVKSLTDQINQVVETAKEDVKDTEVFDVQLRVAKEGEDQVEVDKENLDALIQADSELNQLIEKRFELEKKNLEQRAEFEKQELARKNRIDQEKELNNLMEDRDKLIADLGIKDGVALTKEQSDAKIEIEKNYQIRLKELEKENAQRNADLAKDQLIVDETLKDDLVKLEEDKNNSIKEENEKVLESFKTNEDKKKEIAEKNAELELQREKEKQEAIQELIKATADYFIKRSEEKIAQLEEEIARAEENQSYLEDLAKEGNISAQQSLAENQRIIDEANKRKLEEEKRQQRIKLAETALTTYSQKVEEGSKTPLADTIRDIALLQQFVSTLPAFEEGIEDTGSNGQGVDGRGGFHAILHPNERVVPKALNQKIGSMTNEQLATLAQEYQNGKIIRDGMQIASAMDTLLIANKIDELNNTIRNKPETNIELGEITQSMMEIVKSTKKGNTTMYNRYKIKK